jgi:hypothetical protein
MTTAFRGCASDTVEGAGGSGARVRAGEMAAAVLVAVPGGPAT